MIISILSPKGGSGKSTVALTLATVFAHNPELNIALVDADPRQSIARIWQDRRNETQGGSAPFTIISSPEDDLLLDTLDAARSEYHLIFVDLEGTAGLMTSYAAAANDLCVIPMRPSVFDADATASALRMISNTGRAAQREIPSVVLLTQTGAAIVTTSHREIRAELDTQGIACLRTELIQRAAYERMVADGRTLFEMDTTPSVRGAIDNAARLAQELAAFIEQLEHDDAA